MNEERLARIAEIIKNIVPIKKEPHVGELNLAIDLCETMKKEGFTKEQARMNLKQISNNIIKSKALNYVFGDKESK